MNNEIRIGKPILQKLNLNLNLTLNQKYLNHSGILAKTSELNKTIMKITSLIFNLRAW
jgi:hypothetical protein